jgi:L-alanine-DL-glutamate epimerase-like enolase superfamily enzyme
VKVTRVDLYHVEIPPIAAIARHTPKIYDITLCRVVTDEGLEGIGETAVYTLPEAGRAALEAQAAAYVGQDPLSVDAFAQQDLFECAFLDLQGQALGLPVWRFFGPQVRDRVPVSYWSSPMPAAETAAEAEAGRRLGFTNHKLKARSHNIVETIDLMRRAAGHDYTVGVDPNTEFRHVHTAACLAAQLEPFGTVANLEDPVLKDNLDWYRLLREKTTIPIAMHIGVPQGRRPCRGADVLATLKAECVDQLTLGGRAQEVRAAAAVAAAGNVPVWVQMGGVCLGVLAAYSVHVQCTIPNATLPCDELPFVREADVLGGSLALAEGHFTVPEGPGLGVQLDLDVVERYRVR